MNDNEDRQRVRQALSAIPFLADALDATQIEALAARARIAHFHPGAILMAQDDFGSSMFGLISGEVEVTYTDSHQREREVARLGRGEIVGEIALLTGDRRTATVTAISAVEAVEVTKTAFERLIAQSPEIVDSFAVTLAVRHAALEKLERDSHAGLIEDFMTKIRRVFRGFFGGDEAGLP